MCHYTIRRCGECGRYCEVTPQVCDKHHYEQDYPSVRGFCYANKTNDGTRYPEGGHEVICESRVPFPFVAFHYPNDTFHSISVLHPVQELLALCSICSPEGAITRRAADLGGFLFHLEFGLDDIWSRPRRVPLGRYVVDYCKDKACHKAGCEKCEETGNCGHHGSLNQFKHYDEYQPSMYPLLLKHCEFLEEADLFEHRIRSTYLAPALPSPQSQLAQFSWTIADTARFSDVSYSAQYQATSPDLTSSVSSPESMMTLQQLAPSTPPTSVETSLECESPNPIEEESNCKPQPQPLHLSKTSADVLPSNSQPEPMMQPRQPQDTKPPTRRPKTPPGVSSEAWAIFYKRRQPTVQLPSPPGSENEAFQCTTRATQVLRDSNSGIMEGYQAHFMGPYEFSSLKSSNSENPLSPVGASETAFGDSSVESSGVCKDTQILEEPSTNVQDNCTDSVYPIQFDDFVDFSGLRSEEPTLQERAASANHLSDI
jgi:hypothetical protein